MILGLFAMMIFSGILSLTGMANFLVFSPFILWALYNNGLFYKRNMVIMFMLFFIYLTFHFIIFKGYFLNYIQYIIISYLSFNSFTQAKIILNQKVILYSHLIFLLIFYIFSFFLCIFEYAINERQYERVLALLIFVGFLSNFKTKF